MMKMTPTKKQKEWQGKSSNWVLKQLLYYANGMGSWEHKNDSDENFWY